MFGKNETTKEVIKLRVEVQSLKTLVNELKQIMLEGIKATETNREAIKSGTTIVEVEKRVARKKPKPRLRTATGWKQVTEGEIAEFVKLFDQGLSFTEISAQTGRSASIISKKIRPIIEARVK